MKKIQLGKTSQTFMIVIMGLITLIVAAWLWLSAQNKQNGEHSELENGEATEKAEKEGVAEESHGEGEIELSPQQLIEQGLKIENVEMGAVEQVENLPGKLVVNTDQQAHISPNFSGHVEQVLVELGQTVQKGQTLAVLSVPELIDQQANFRMAQANLDLARQDFQREQQLWKQGISAKQDFQRAENAYRQAQISVQSTQARLNALGASGKNGRFALKTPISGIISQKDIVVGENVQLADQLFVIEKIKDLWLEFNLPTSFQGKLNNNQKIQFKTNGSDSLYDAVIQNISSQADIQTGRLIVRAKLTTQSNDLRPNVLVNVLLNDAQPKMALRVQKSALQSIESKSSIFIVDSEQKDKIHLKAQVVEVGQQSQDGQWIEIVSGLEQGQKYVSQGSFILKSELEKGEADHGH